MCLVDDAARFVKFDRIKGTTTAVALISARVLLILAGGSAVLYGDSLRIDNMGICPLHIDPLGTCRKCQMIQSPSIVASSLVAAFTESLFLMLFF